MTVTRFHIHPRLRHTGDCIEGHQQRVATLARASAEAADAELAKAEAALGKADELAEQCDDAFYHLDGVGLPEFYHTLTTYRQARDATR